MNPKETALRQIDDIYAILQENLKAILSGTLMIAVGIGVMMIPLFELLFDATLNPALANFGQGAPALIFIAHTAFYWTFFTFISRYFDDTRSKNNPLIHKVFAVGKALPCIALPVAASLAQTGNNDLIAPFVLVLVGCFFAFYGQFTDAIVSYIAGSLITAGVIGILLIPYDIPHLWMYLVCYEGLAFVIMGLVLARLQKI